MSYFDKPTFSIIFIYLIRANLIVRKVERVLVSAGSKKQL